MLPMLGWRGIRFRLSMGSIAGCLIILRSQENYEAARDASHAWLERDTVSATGYKFLGMAYEGMGMNDPESIQLAFMAYNAA